MIHPAAAPALARVPTYPTAPPRAPVHLASNESALGPSPRAVAAARDALLGGYPEPDAATLRRALAERHDRAVDEVVVTCGSTEAIQLLVRAFPGAVAAPAGSFPLYERTATAAGREVRLAPRRADHRVDLAALAACVTADTALVFVASPDNPTGTSAQGLREWLRALPWTVVPVIDEAYAELCDAVDLAGAHPNLVVLRSFSKAYGLAALRIGYALASAAIVDALDRVRDPFNVGGPAQAAALAALADGAWLAAVRAHTEVGRRRLIDGLRARGFEAVESDANFVFVPRGAGLAELAEARGVTVRRMDAWGYPGAVRVTVGRDEEHARLFAALDAARGLRCAS